MTSGQGLTGGLLSARTTPRSLGAVVLWASLIAGAAYWGGALNEDGAEILLHAPPIFGEPDLRLEDGLLWPVLVAFAVIAFGPTAAERLSWRPLLAISMLAAGAWAVLLAVSTGAEGFTEPLTGTPDYLRSARTISSAGEFLSNFTAQLDIYSTHVRGHPPGMPLILHGLREAGLYGATPAAWLIAIVAASTVPAVLIGARAVAEEQVARRAAPFLVLAPAAVWIATSADALFMGVVAWGVTLVILGTVRRGSGADALAVAGGVILGLGLFLSYGLVLMAAIPIAVAVAERRLRPLALAAAGALAVMLCFALLGFWWLDGYQALQEQYRDSIAQTRPFGFFVFNNLAGLALALGPAVVAALAGLRDRRLWLLAGGGLAAVAFADLSGLSKGEVERIWLPFMPWIILATAALSSGKWANRAWLGAQATCAIAIQALVVTEW